MDEVAHAVPLEIKALEVNVLVDDVRVSLLLRVLRCRPRMKRATDRDGANSGFGENRVSEYTGYGLVRGTWDWYKYAL